MNERFQAILRDNKDNPAYQIPITDEYTGLMSFLNAVAYCNQKAVVKGKKSIRLGSHSHNNLDYSKRNPI